MRGCPLPLFVCFLTEEEEEEEEEEEDAEAIVACAPRVVCVVANILCVFMYPCVCARESVTFHFHFLSKSLQISKIFVKNV
jgi:hypothetical protein